MQTAVANTPVKAIIHDLMEGMRFKTVCLKYNIIHSRLVSLLHNEGIIYNHLRDQRMKEWEQQSLLKCIALYKSLNRLPTATQIKQVIVESVSSCLMLTILKLHLAGKTNQFGIDVNLHQSLPLPDPEITFTAQTPQHIFQEIERLFDQLKRMPNKHEFQVYSNYKITEVYRHFSKWEYLMGNMELKTIIKNKKRLANAQHLNKRQQTKKEILLNYLHIKMKQLGRVPLKSDMLEDKKHSYMQYYRHFGSFHKALALAGINNIRIARRQQYNQTIKSMLRVAANLYKKYNRIPTEQEFIEQSNYTYAHYKKQFGSIFAALRQCGFQVKTIPNNLVPDEKLIQHLQQVAAQKGATPTISDMKKHKLYSYMVYVRRFGTWNQALQKAGFTLQRPVTRKYTNEQLINQLQVVAKTIGRNPRTTDLKIFKGISVPVFIDRFGSWNLALKAAGFQVNTARSTKYSAAQLLNKVKEVAAPLGYTPTFTQLQSITGIKYHNFKNRFTNYRTLCTAVGLPPAKTNQVKIKTEQLVIQIQQLTTTLGRTPNLADIKNAGGNKLRYQTLTCGGLKKVLYLAGLQQAPPLRKNIKPEIINQLKQFTAQIGYTPTHKNFMQQNKSRLYYACVTHFKNYKNALTAAGL